MKNIYVFVILMLIILVILHYNIFIETYEVNSYNITPNITVDMDFKGSELSSYPYYPNNLINAPNKIITQMQLLQSYQPTQDGPTETTYVSDEMITQKNINNPNNLEGFNLIKPKN